MVTVSLTVELKSHLYEALKTIAEAFDLSMEELLNFAAESEIQGFLSLPLMYVEVEAEETAEKVRAIYEA